MKFDVKDATIPSHIVERWQSFVNIIADILTVPSAMINRIEPPDLEVFRSSINSDNPFPTGTRMPVLGVYCESAAKRRRRVQVFDARKDPEWADSPTAKAGIFAYLGYPLFWPDGDIFGTICVVDTKENRWGDKYDNLIMGLKDAVEAHLALIYTIEQLDTKNRELQHALSEVNTLQGLLPICANCKKIRDDGGYWSQIESYIEHHSRAEFSHSICPDCAKELYPDLDIYRQAKPDQTNIPKSE